MTRQFWCWPDRRPAGRPARTRRRSGTPHGHRHFRCVCRRPITAAPDDGFAAGGSGRVCPGPSRVLAHALLVSVWLWPRSCSCTGRAGRDATGGGPRSPRAAAVDWERKCCGRQDGHAREPWRGESTCYAARRLALDSIGYVRVRSRLQSPTVLVYNFRQRVFFICI